MNLLSSNWQENIFYWESRRSLSIWSYNMTNQEQINVKQVLYVKLIHNMLNFLNGIIYLPYLEQSIIILRISRWKLKRNHDGDNTKVRWWKVDSTMSFCLFTIVLSYFRCFEPCVAMALTGHRIFLYTFSIFLQKYQL